MGGLFLAGIAGMGRKRVIERLAIDVLGVLGQVASTEGGRSALTA